MAQLTESTEPHAAAIPAASQFWAVARLRWHIFRNGLRRQQNSQANPSSLILTILLRLFLWPIFALIAIAPAIGAGFFAFFAVSENHAQGLISLLTALAVLWQFIALTGAGMAASAPTFDPASLLRFPLEFPRYVVLRLLLGLLIPSTLMGCLALFACAVGITVAAHSLALPALVVLGLYAALNVFLSRTIALWMERWLSTRRAREIFGVAMALVFVGFQVFNMHIGKHASHAGSLLLTLLHSSNRLFAWLPPGFAASSILEVQHPLARLAQFAALLASTAVVFVTLAIRLRKQFLGEHLSEGAPRAAAAPTKAATAQRHAAPTQPNASATAESTALLSPVVRASLRKEWAYLRNGGVQLVRMLTPLIFVFIFSRGILARHPAYLISGAVGYALIGPMTQLYNIFAADGPGLQLYLLAPIRLRDIVLAKNLASLAIMLIDAILAWCIILAVAPAPIPFSTQLSSALWIVFFIFLNLTVGTLRSIQAPRKAVIPDQASALRTPAGNRTSGLLVLATLIGSMLLQIPVHLAASHLNLPWFGACIFAPLAAAALAAYTLLLRNIDPLILKHRDRLAEELCST
ncbi:MAG TPA: hypothetical protein VGU46_10885 [Acidobacteriaceae bacterium]|nr:hypothetical protein [Acidobacteriaceae bacterium]